LLFLSSLSLPDYDEDDARGGDVIGMAEQIKDFETVLANLTARMGDESASNGLAKFLFLFSVGGNDLSLRFKNRSKGSLGRSQHVVAGIHVLAVL
ncbi:hypothetical protein BHM03_00060360, partial [Ensete ventricosum]